jgi:ATP-dependent protease HslVU (ClpYQ) peptidase subunit
MSVVACKVTKDGYEIASDSISVRGYTQTRNNSKLSKLFKVNGLVIGSVGTAEEAALLRLFAATHKPASEAESALLEFWAEFSEWKHKKTDKREIENHYLIGLGHKIFHIEQWLIDQVITYEAIGAGMDFALAALYLGHDVEKAVETAIELSVFCASPVQVIRVTANG